jgi:Fe-S cluster biogenesis protein NfuA
VRDERILAALRSVVAPLVEADDGELFLVEANPRRVRLHLRGKFSGCPGNTLVAERVILPLLRKSHPDVVLDLSSGPLLPEGAERVRAEGTPP